MKKYKQIEIKLWDHLWSQFSYQLGYQLIDQFWGEPLYQVKLEMRAFAGAYEEA